jgi:hypothetical protein
MSDHESKTEQASTRGSTGDRSMGFDCCDIRMGDAMAECPCGSIMRRHPVVTSAFLGVMGLAVIVIPAGAILGIIAFFRTI